MSPVRFWLSALLGLLKAVLAGVVQLVEHLLAKEKVTGSSPVTRSQQADGNRCQPFIFGDVAKW